LGVVKDHGVVAFQWACTVATLTGVFLMSRQKYAAGWTVSILANSAWAVLAWMTDMPGLFVVSVVITIMAVFGLRGVRLLEQDEIELQSLTGFDPGPPTVIPSGKQQGEARCCQMNAKFITGLVGERRDIPAPIGVVDFIEEWNGSRPVKNRRTGVGNTVFMRMRYCPFCGEEDHRYKGVAVEE
jgi:hypothetical protein